MVKPNILSMQSSSATTTREILRQYQIRPNKRLSQNFLIDETIFSKITEEVTRENPESVFEVGAGLGILTELLSEKVNQILALELDQKFCHILTERLKSKSNIRVIHGNILTFNPSLYFESRDWVAVGNLPYHISGAIIRWFLDNRRFFRHFYFMLQKEVAERMVSKPGPKSYGVLSILCQYFTDPQWLFDVPAGAFLPAPQVESAFIKMTPKLPEGGENPLLIQLVKRSFSSRRKTIFNNLKAWNLLPPTGWEALLQECGVEKRERAERLSLQTFLQMAEAVRNYITPSS